MSKLLRHACPLERHACICHMNLWRSKKNIPNGSMDVLWCLLVACPVKKQWHHMASFYQTSEHISLYVVSTRNGSSLVPKRAKSSSRNGPMSVTQTHTLIMTPATVKPTPCLVDNSHILPRGKPCSTKPWPKQGIWRTNANRTRAPSHLWKKTHRNAENLQISRSLVVGTE